MKKQLLLGISLLPMLAFAQQPKPFSIKGEIGHLNSPAKAYIDWMDFTAREDGHPDSVDVVNGKFEFKGELKGIGTARIALSHSGEGKNFAIYAPGDVIYIYFGAENIVMKSKDSLANAKFTGSKVYNAFQQYVKATGGTIMQITKEANDAMRAGTPEQQKDTNFIKVIDREFRRKVAARTELQLKYAEAHPNEVMGLVSFSESFSMAHDWARSEKIFNNFSKELRETGKGRELNQRIKAVTLTAKGAEAPVFTMNDVDGKPLKLSDLRGKYVLLDFWASWCHPCRDENPNVVSQYEKYKDKGFTVLSVSLDNDKQRWVEAIQHDGMPWYHVCDYKAWNGDVTTLYGISGVPTCFLIDPQGKIIGKDLRGEDLRNALAKIFQ
jgi:peroxiredoxin